MSPGPTGDLPFAFSAAPMLVVLRFEPADPAEFVAQAQAAVALLGERAGCRSIAISRSTDNPALFAITSIWADAGSYRRALSHLDVKMHAVPLLSQAIDESTAFEVLHEISGGASTEFAGALAGDADSVRLGHAAAAEVSTGLSRGRFASLDEGAELAARLLVGRSWSAGQPEVVVAVLPNGAPMGLAAARVLDVPAVGVEVDAESGSVGGLPDVAGRSVLIADDMVETGRAARVLGTALRTAGAKSVSLVAPICPRESQAALVGVIDEVVALARPLGRRAKSWHYADPSGPTVEQARASLGTSR